MLFRKFQGHLSSGSVLKGIYLIYGHSGQLRHVNRTKDSVKREGSINTNNA